MRVRVSEESDNNAGGMKMTDIAINGDNAIALAWKQIDPDVCAAYPITPQTIIVERFSDYVADGEVSTEFVTTESEHSAITVCIAASSAGARAFTATASVGLGHMWEMLGVASGFRTPVIMAVANRALSAPININNDHGDAMARLDLHDFAAFFIQQESRHVNRQLDMDGRRTFFHGFFFNDAEHLQGK